MKKHCGESVYEGLNLNPVTQKFDVKREPRLKTFER